MNVVVIGCGRMGSAVALKLARANWHVSVVDERQEAIDRLGEGWQGEFHCGHGMDIDLLRRAGMEHADAVIVVTDGDNSNIVIAQIAQKQFGVGSVVVRVLDPARAEFYAEGGLNVICPTKSAIEAAIGAVSAVVAA